MPQGKATLLCKNEQITCAILFETDVAQPRQVAIPFMFKNTCGSPVTGITLQTTDSMNTKLVNLGSADEGTFALQPGGSNMRRLYFSCESFVRPQKLQGTVTWNGGSMDFQLVIPCSAFVVAQPGVAKDAFTSAVAGPNCAHLSTTKLSVPPQQMKRGIEVIASALHVTMIEVVSGAASFFGLTTAGQPVAVLVKAKSSGLVLEVRSFDENFVASLVAEASAAITSAMA